MAELTATAEELGKGIRIPIGAGEVIRVKIPLPRVRITGLFFDLNKCFLLPDAIPGIKGIKEQYGKSKGSEILVVGHTDTSGADEDNLTLSLERADSIAAYLGDDVAAWDAFFADVKGDTKKWGTREIQLMLSKLPDGQTPFYGGSAGGTLDDETRQAIGDFQAANGLPANEKIDAPTRKAIITQYMALDGTSLPKDARLVTHGAGESFPASETGDGVRDQDNRRVEIFFFTGKIDPPPPKDKKSRKGSTEYPAWRDKVTESVDFSGDGSPPPPRDFHVSALLRSNSGAFILANRPFVLTITGGGTVEGTTDADGLAEVPDLPAGDHKLEIAGATTFVPALPKDITGRLHRVSGAKPFAG